MLSNPQQCARSSYRVLSPLPGEAQVRSLIRRSNIQGRIFFTTPRLSPSEQCLSLSPDDPEHASSPPPGEIQAGVSESHSFMTWEEAVSLAWAKKELSGFDR